MDIPLRSLILEDSEDDALLVVRELRRGGYDLQAERVDTPGAMSAALDEHEWDVILSDYNMPSFTALDALMLLQDKGLDLPFIIISGTVGEDVAVAAMRAGAHDYLLKDSLARLVPAVQREIGQAKMREAQRAAEVKFGRLFDSAPDYCYIISPDGSIVEASSSAQIALGYTKDELAGRSVFALYAPESRDKARRLFEQWQETGKLSNEELVIFTKRGERRTVLLSAEAVRDPAGRILYSMSFQRDITRRKRAEEELENHREHLEELIEERTAELRKAFDLMVGRELRMAELKEAICRLRAQLEEVGLTPVADDRPQTSGARRTEDQFRHKAVSLLKK